MSLIKKFLFYSSFFLRLVFAVYLTIFRSKSFCVKKLSLFVHGYIKLKDCRFHVCQFQACNKKSKMCPCGKIKNGELLSL